MNVEDIGEIPPHEGNKLGKIFERQRELRKKYHLIERKNGFRVECHDLDDRYHQHRLKDLAWRVVEEIAEALDAKGDIHRLEELADATHFMVELLIDSGMSEIDTWTDPLPKDRELLDWQFEFMSGGWTEQADSLHELIRHLGCAMNCLKNKPWKNTHMRTDVGLYKYRLAQAWLWFIRACLDQELTSLEFYRMYFKKSEVNIFRQASNY